MTRRQKGAGPVAERAVPEDGRIAQLDAPMPVENGSGTTRDVDAPESIVVVSDGRRRRRGRLERQICVKLVADPDDIKAAVLVFAESILDEVVDKLRSATPAASTTGVAGKESP